MKGRAKINVAFVISIFIRKPTMITVVSCLIWAGFCFCAWNQSSPGGHKAEKRRLPLLFLPGANTHGVKHQSELSWFYQFASSKLATWDSAVLCVLTNSVLPGSRNAFQDKIEKQTITPHKFTSLKSFAKVVTPPGLRAMQCRAQGPQSRTLGAGSFLPEWANGYLRLNLALKYPFKDT